MQRLSIDLEELEKAGTKPEELADDGTNWLGKIVEKPWGHEREIHRVGPVSIWQLTINPGCETSMHCHPGKETMLIVEDGYCIFETLSATLELKPGDFVYIERGAFHRTRAIKGACLLEIESPANKRDLVRIADRYGRTGKGYER